MLRNSHGVGIAPPAADRDELDGGMTMMKGMMGTFNMRGRKNKASKAGGSKTTRALAIFLPGPPAQAKALGGRPASAAHRAGRSCASGPAQAGQRLVGGSPCFFPPSSAQAMKKPGKGPASSCRVAFAVMRDKSVHGGSGGISHMPHFGPYWPSPAFLSET